MAPDPSARHALAFGPFKLLRSERLLLDDGVPVRLGSRALDLLVALVDRAGDLVSREELEACVWPSTVVEETNLRVHISALRRVLGDGRAGARYIVNQPGRGYCFVAPVARVLLPAADLPAARTGEVAGSLPARLTHVVGRRETVLHLADQLRVRRLVTLVGPGGMGKTTVALAVAEELAPHYANGAYFIDLAAVTQGRSVPVAVALGFRLTTVAEDVTDSVSAFLRDKQALAVLDNCEHVLDAIVPYVERLLSLAPGLDVIATSREPLRADGEWVNRLPSLGLPDQLGELTASQAMAFPAVQLFVERAMAASSSFELSDAEAPVVVALCHRLDGNPLAIELVAARVDVFGVGGLARRLDAFVLQLKGQRTAPPRHQSLNAALDWSYSLLTQAERSTLMRLSIFSGRFTLQMAVDFVAWDDAREPLTTAQAFECIMGLIDKSLVASDSLGDEAFLSLQELTRAFARTRLEASGDQGAVATQHASLVLRFMRRAADAWPGASSKSDWFRAYGWAAVEIRAALAWAFSGQGDPMVGAWLAATVWPLAIPLNPFDDPLTIDRALEAVAAAPGQTSSVLEVRLRIASAAFHHMRGQAVQQEQAQTALELARMSGDARYQAELLMTMAIVTMGQGQYLRATELVEELQAVSRPANHPLTKLAADRTAAQVWHFAGSHVRSLALAERVLGHPAQRGELGPAGMIDHAVSMRIVLSRILWLQGYAGEALRVAAEAVAKAADDVPALCQALSLAACPIALWCGDAALAGRWISRLESEYARHAFNGGFAPTAARIPWRLATQFDGGMPQRPARPSPDILQLDHLITVNPAFVTPHAVERAARGEAGWCAPEILRAQGDAVLAADPDDAEAAATLYRRSLAMAVEQGALAWELRSATSLARLWQGKGNGAEARAILEPVYRRFSDGLPSADLRAARQVLEASA